MRYTYMTSMSDKQPAHQLQKVTKKPASQKETPWPWLFSVNPKVLIWAVVTWLAFAWFMFLAHDIWQWFQLTNRPMWFLLFNDKPVEWTQWFLLAFAIAMSGYLAARLDVLGRKGAGKFFFWFAIGLGIMLIEEAGDIRHVIGGEVGRLVIDDKILGIPHRAVTDLPYLALVAAIPLYAIARYGKYVWQAVAARKYFVISVVLFAIAAISSGARYIGDFYVRAGMWIDDNLLGGRFPAAEDHTPETTYLLLIDSPIEESIETMAVTLLVVGILIYTAYLRSEKLPRENQST